MKYVTTGLFCFINAVMWYKLPPKIIIVYLKYFIMLYHGVLSNFTKYRMLNAFEETDF